MRARLRTALLAATVVVLGLLAAPATQATTVPSEQVTSSTSLYPVITPLGAGADGTSRFQVQLHNTGVVPASAGDRLLYLGADYTKTQTPPAGSGAGWSCADRHCRWLAPIPPGTASPPLLVTAYGPDVSAWIGLNSPFNISHGASSLVSNEGILLAVTPGLVRGGEATRSQIIVSGGAVGISGPISVAVGTTLSDNAFGVPNQGGAPATVTGQGWICTMDLRCQHPGPLAAGADLPVLSLSYVPPGGLDRSKDPLLTLLTVQAKAAGVSAFAQASFDVVRDEGPGRLVVAGSVPGARPERAGVSSVAREVEFTFDNPGREPVGNVRLSFSRSEGVTIRPSGGRSLEGLAPGERVTHTLPLTIHDWAAEQVSVSARVSWTLPSPGEATTTVTLRSGRSGPNLSPLVTRGQPELTVAGEPVPFEVQVRNVGNEPTSGPIDLILDHTKSPSRTDPRSDLIVMPASGQGWTCMPRLRRCTTRAVLEPGRSLPPVRVDVPTSPDDAGKGITVRVVTPDDADAVGVPRPSDGTGDDVNILTAPLRESPTSTCRTTPALRDDLSCQLDPFHVAALPSVPDVVGEPFSVAFQVTGRTALLSGPFTARVFDESMELRGTGWLCSDDTCTFPGPLLPGADLPELVGTRVGGTRAGSGGLEVIFGEQRVLGSYRTTVVTPVRDYTPAPVPPVVPATYDFSGGIRIDFPEPVQYVSEQSILLFRTDGTPWPIQVGCAAAGTCFTSASPTTVFVYPLVPLTPGQYAVVLTEELRSLREARVGPVISPLITVDGILSAPTVKPASYTAGTSFAGAPWSVTFDRATRGIGPENVQLVDGRGTPAPVAIACSPGPCLAGPVLTVTLTPSSTALFPGRGYAIRVLPPVTERVVQGPGSRAYLAPVVVLLADSPGVVGPREVVRLTARLIGQGPPVRGGFVRFFVREAGQPRFTHVTSAYSDASGGAYLDVIPRRTFAWFAAVISPDGQVQRISTPQVVEVRP